MLSCKDATKLMSQSFDRHLTWMERAGLRLHLMICKACPEAHRQLEFLHKACQRYASLPVETDSMQTGLKPETRERIMKNLQRKDGQEDPSASH